MRILISLIVNGFSWLLIFECANICKNNGLKIALYSGATECDDDIFELFDYVKVGPYIEELGGLKSKKTISPCFGIYFFTIFLFPSVHPKKTLSLGFLLDIF